MKRIIPNSILASLLLITLSGCEKESGNLTNEVTDTGSGSAIDCSEPNSPGCVEGRLLHVPSPDWRDQIIYFLMIDRFADGDPSNNDQGVGLYDPSKESHYSGGDLKGITNNVSYIKDLGATAVWLTPQVANMWWDPLTSYGGYHGYWARDFKSVDEHYGSLDDFKDLSHELHSNGMFLVQDIVVNHVGNFFGYNGPYDPNDLSKNFYINEEAIPTKAPTQAPFDMIDVNNPEHQEAAIYHWTPDIADFSDYVQEKTYKTGGLSDLKTTNPVVQAALKDSFGFWIAETGVDAFRIDTVKYVEAEFYEEFLHGAKGIYETARSTGREDFYTFGEVFNTSTPLSDEGEKKLAKYTTSDKTKRIDAPIGFPLYKEMNRVFAGGAPTQYISYRVDAQMRAFNDPYLVANFIDNHDVERFIAGGSTEGFKLAYTLMMTVPGVPVIYQGDEQLFVEFRKSMFAGGYQSEKDYFNQSSEMFQYIKNLANVRKTHRLFSRGDIEFLQDNPIGPGILAYKRSYDGKVGYVVMNTSKDSTLLNHMPTPFSESNSKPEIVFSENHNEKLVFDKDGFLTQVLPANSAVVFVGDDAETASVAQKKVSQDKTIEISGIKDIYRDEKQALVTGSVSSPNVELLRIIDGEYGKAQKFNADENGQWQFELPINDLGEKNHFVEVYWPGERIASDRKNYTVVNTQAEISRTVEDPLGDDKGPSGKYQLPTHESMGCDMDIKQLKAEAGGSVLELKFTMCRVSQIWQPPNLFDHVAFTIFFDTQADAGEKDLPIINAAFPAEDGWDLAHMVYGWGNYIYNSEGASKTKEGQKLGVAPEIEVDPAANTILFRYNGKKIGVDNWKGTTVYVTTWDKDGGGAYRNLGEQSTAWQFGGASERAAKILDDLVIRID